MRWSVVICSTKCGKPCSESGRQVSAGTCRQHCSPSRRPCVPKCVPKCVPNVVRSNRCLSKASRAARCVPNSFITTRATRCLEYHATVSDFNRAYTFLLKVCSHSHYLPVLASEHNVTVEYNSRAMVKLIKLIDWRRIRSGRVWDTESVRRSRLGVGGRLGFGESLEESTRPQALLRK